MSSDGTSDPVSSGASQQGNVIACAVATWAIAALFAGTRFFLRAYLIKVFGPEDWAILVALVLSALLSATFIIEAHYGLGKYVPTIAIGNRESLAETAWFALLWFALTVLATKISILLLYMRTLTYDWIQKALRVLMTMVVLTGITGVGLISTACIPLRAYWDPDVKATYCHSVHAYLAILGIQLGTDFLIFLLPLPVIWSMRAPRDQKLLLLTLFSFGFFICIVSVIRITELTSEPVRQGQDRTYGSVSLNYWSMIEANTGIVCACVMTLKPLVSRLVPSSVRKSISSSPGQMLPGLSIHPPTIGSEPSRKNGVVKKQSWLSAQLARLDRSLPTVDEADGTIRESAHEHGPPSEGCLPPIPLALLSTVSRSRSRQVSHNSSLMTSPEQRTNEGPLEPPRFGK